MRKSTLDSNGSRIKLYLCWSMNWELEISFSSNSQAAIDIDPIRIERSIAGDEWYVFLRGRDIDNIERKGEVLWAIAGFERGRRQEIMLVASPISNFCLSHLTIRII
jgi:hypothetical protein